jgi:hypothetical protein
MPVPNMEQDQEFWSALVAIAAVTVVISLLYLPLVF